MEGSRPLASRSCHWRGGEGPPRRWREGRHWRLEEGEVIVSLVGEKGRPGDSRRGGKREGNLRFWGYRREGK